MGRVHPRVGFGRVKQTGPTSSSDDRTIGVTLDCMECHEV